MVVGSSVIQKWKALFYSFLKPKMAFMLLLGFCSGVPLLLVFSTLSAWMRDVGVSRTEIGYFVWVGFAYSFKFLWSPCIDKIPAFGIEKFIGRRKGWVFLSQIGVVAGILLLSSSRPGDSLALTAWAAIFTAFWGATQDVAIDAWRIEIGTEEEQGLLASAYQIGYRVAYYIAVAFAFILADHIDWHNTYMVLALLFACAAFISLFAPDIQRNVGRKTSGQSGRDSLEKDLATRQGAFVSRTFMSQVKEGIYAAFKTVLETLYSLASRYGWYIVLVFFLISSYRITDFVMGTMANPFYLDLGFSKTQIGTSVKVFGPIFTLVGASIAGIGIFRYGLRSVLVIGAVLGAVSNLTYAWLAFEAEKSSGVPLTYLMMALAVENMSGGFAGTVLIAFMSSLVERQFAATQYALFSSLYAFSGKFLSGFSGRIVDYFAVDDTKLSGYGSFFTLTALIGGIAVFFSVLWLFMTSKKHFSAEKGKV